MTTTFSLQIARAEAEARTLAHRYGYGSLEAREAREEVAALHEQAWRAQFDETEVEGRVQ